MTKKALFKVFLVFTRIFSKHLPIILRLAVHRPPNGQQQQRHKGCEETCQKLWQHRPLADLDHGHTRLHLRLTELPIIVRTPPALRRGLLTAVTRV